MESFNTDERGKCCKFSLSHRLQQLDIKYKAAGGKFKNYKISDLFNIYSPAKRFNANAVKFGGKFPYVVRTSKNNGIRDYITEDEKYLSPANTFSFGQDTATVFYQDKPYFTGDKIKVMRLKVGILNKERACYLLSVIRKAFSSFSWGQNSFDENVLNNVEIVVPTKNNQIDFNYMEKYIHVLETERVHVLENYLHMSGLDSYSLTSEDATVLNNFRFGNMVFKEYKIGELFEKQILKFRKKKFDKNLDISKEANSEFNLPLVNAKDGNNGIMYYGRSSDFDSVEMSIDIVNDGAISTGNVYAQPQRTGVLYNAYLIKSKMNFNLSAEQLLYFARSIEKSIKKKFGYDNKASWEKVKEENIYLPVNQQDEIDYEFMETYTRAIEKKVIKNVIDWKDKEIERTKDVVSSVS